MYSRASVDAVLLDRMIIVQGSSLLEHLETCRSVPGQPPPLRFGGAPRGSGDPRPAARRPPQGSVLRPQRAESREPLPHRPAGNVHPRQEVMLQDTIAAPAAQREGTRSSRSDVPTVHPLRVGQSSRRSTNSGFPHPGPTAPRGLHTVPQTIPARFRLRCQSGRPGGIPAQANPL